eukprot:1205995-Rhodomonas_salina.1
MSGTNIRYRATRSTQLQLSAIGRVSSYLPTPLLCDFRYGHSIRWNEPTPLLRDARYQHTTRWLSVYGPPWRCPVLSWRISTAMFGTELAYQHSDI